MRCFVSTDKKKKKILGQISFTFAGLAALLRDGVRTGSERAGLALTVNFPIGAGA